MDECDKKVEQLEVRVDGLERRFAAENPNRDSELMHTIEQLKCELNDREQDMLLNDIEISGVSEHSGENLCHVVNVLSTKLGVTLSDQDIVNVTRTGRSLKAHVTAEPAVVSSATPRPRIILVSLARRATQDGLLHAARVPRGATTEGTGLPAPPVHPLGFILMRG